MTSPEKATARSLVYRPQWDTDNMAACCASMVVVRLEAEYCTLTEKRNNLKSLIRDKFDLPTVRPDNTCFESFVRYSLLSPAFSVTLDQAFGAVLVDMLQECTSTQSSLFICTDNVSEPPMGDVHVGPFSTRGLVQFLVDNEVANVYRGATQFINKRYTSFMTTEPSGRHKAVATWSWTLKLRAARRLVHKFKRVAIADYNNSVMQLPKIPEDSTTARASADTGGLW